MLLPCWPHGLSSCLQVATPQLQQQAELEVEDAAALLASVPDRAGHMAEVELLPGSFVPHVVRELVACCSSMRDGGSGVGAGAAGQEQPGTAAFAGQVLGRLCRRWAQGWGACPGAHLSSPHLDMLQKRGPVLQVGTGLHEHASWAPLAHQPGPHSSMPALLMDTLAFVAGLPPKLGEST